VVWTDANQYSHDYSWYVVASDGVMDQKSGTYSFQTKSSGGGADSQNGVRPTCTIHDWPGELKVGEKGLFTFSAEDPDSSQIWFVFDWGESSSMVIEGVPYASYIEEKTYYQGGTFEVKVHAKDETGIFGEWSDPVYVEVSDAGDSEGGKCFHAETEIVMADGSLKNIEDILIGDRVTSFDTKTQTYKQDVVTNVHRYESEETDYDYHLLINNMLKVTPYHPFYINGRWVTAENLKIFAPIINRNIISRENLP
jgi:hypothetical protein